MYIESMKQDRDIGDVEIIPLYIFGNLALNRIDLFECWGIPFLGTIERKISVNFLILRIENFDRTEY